MEIKLCECGCGEPVTKPTNRFICGHNTKWEYENDPIVTKKRKEHAYEASQTKEFSKKVSRETKKALKKPETVQKNKDRMYKRYSDPIELERHTKLMKKIFNTPEQRALRRKIQRERFKNPKEREKNKRAAEINWSDPNKKDHMSEKMKELWKDPNYRESCSGPNASNWRGGISYEPYCDAWADKEYKQSIMERDGFKCINPDCWGTSTRLNVHHINYKKKDCHPKNLCTLCVSCNIRANTNRSWWKAWYQAIIYRRYDLCS